MPDSFLEERLDELVRQPARYRYANRWLDVGFGAGGILQAANRAGWEVYGTEVSAPAADAMRRRGFNVHHGDLVQAPYSPGGFDVVTMIEVVEHVHHLDTLLRRAFVLLRPGGAVYLTTPHGGGISARWLGVQWSVVSPPEHLQLFTLRGMRSALARAGYAERSVRTHALNPYELVGRLKGPEDGRFRGNPRVATSYRLNEALSASAPRRALKTGVNHLLNWTRLGDKLKYEGVKPVDLPGDGP